MSDTPRTDAYERKAAEDAVEYGRPYRPLEFARALERENAELRADKARLDWAEKNLVWPMFPEAPSLRTSIDAARGSP